MNRSTSAWIASDWVIEEPQDGEERDILSPVLLAARTPSTLGGSCVASLLVRRGSCVASLRSTRSAPQHGLVAMRVDVGGGSFRLVAMRVDVGGGFSRCSRLPRYESRPKLT